MRLGQSFSPLREHGFKECLKLIRLGSVENSAGLDFRSAQHFSDFRPRGIHEVLCHWIVGICGDAVRRAWAITKESARPEGIFFPVEENLTAT